MQVGQRLDLETLHTLAQSGIAGIPLYIPAIGRTRIYTIYGHVSCKHATIKLVSKYAPQSPPAVVVGVSPSLGVPAYMSALGPFRF